MALDESVRLIRGGGEGQRGDVLPLAVKLDLT
jgi:hypothetical protein